MGNPQTRRLLVYVAAALVVLVGGGCALMSARRAEAGDPAGGGAGSVGMTLSTAAGGAAAGSDSSTGVFVAPTSSTTTTRCIYVQVVGAVTRPGVYPLPAGARTFEAIAAAGGVTPEGDEQAVSLAAVVGDGARVFVPKRGETPEADQAVSGPSGAGANTGGSLPVVPLSLSDATLEQLDALPGIGPSTARQIVAYREAHGPFTSVRQLDDVTGIGPATLARLEGLVVP